MKFKPYEEYKKVNLPWIDEIPSHWEESRVKAITKLKSTRQKDIDSELELLSVYRDYGVVKRTEKDDNHNIIPEDLSNYKVVYKGDLVLNKMKVWQGSLGVSSYDGIVSPAYIVCSVRTNIFGKYLNYLLRNKMYLTIYNRLSYGVRVDQWDMRYEDFKNIELFLPPKEEQDKIADFLDHNLSKIDKFIELTERQIELLKEQKEVIINNAVTKGIDENVEYKDSGIDWIGEIPTHWEIIRLKRILVANESGNWGEEPSNNTNDIYVLRSTEQTDKGDWRIDWSEVAVRNIVNVDKKNILKRDDLLLTKSSGSFNHIGKVSIVTKKIEEKNVTFSNFMQRLRIGKNGLPYYYWIILNSDVVKQQYRILSTTTTGLSNLNLDNIKNILVTLPPLAEQKEIVAYIEKETNKIDRTIELYKSQIELIKEYRTSLIASAVTGKIDVRDF